MTPKLLLLTFLVTVNYAYCQKSSFVYFLDEKMSACPQDMARYRATGNIDNTGLLYLKCYSRIDNNLVLTAHYTDSTLAKLNGRFESFYHNAKPKEKGDYVNAEKEGVWQHWNSEGNLIDSVVYNGGKVVSSVSYSDEKEFVDDATHRKRSLNDGDRLFAKVDIDAQFPGGSTEWSRYISNEMSRHMNALSKANETGTCVVRFIVDKDGSITDAEAITMKDTKLAKILIKAISNGPKWIPAKQNGRPVKAYRTQPVTFSLQ
jgi:antitoxin component YwqK of YwqJK toxin-antitoxin module